MATIRKLMTLLSKQGLTDKRSVIISQFTNGRTTSVKALDQLELDRLCQFFETEQRKLQNDLDKKRKRLIASIFGMYKKMNKSVSIDYVKAIAARATKVERFNDIPSNRLDSLYNAFLYAQKDLNYAGRLVQGYIDEQTNYN